MNLKTALDNLVLDPEYPRHNFDLALAYEDERQYAAAVSYYLRTSELTCSNILAYESLLRLYICFNAIGNRDHFSENILLMAIAHMPSRPEAYLMLSQHYERTKRWFSAYTYAIIGETMIFDSTEKLNTNVGFPGLFAFRFQRAVTAWWVGRQMESLAIFKELLHSPISEPFAILVKNNIKNITSTLTGGGVFSSSYTISFEFPYYLYKYFSKYSFTQYHNLRLKFDGVKDIKENYSQAFQDMFILGVLNGKRNGRFVEVGCSVPIYNNNTYLLEKEFDWRGVAVDINKDAAALYKKKRLAPVVIGDATKLDYKKIIEENFPDRNVIDYLQIDCEPAHASLKVLLSMPFDKYKFAVITFEHDNYIAEDSFVKEKSRMFLSSIGYKLVVKDVGFDPYSSFEDWWVHPDLVSQEVIDKMLNVVDNSKSIDAHIFYQ